MINIFRFLKGLRILPKSASEADSLGEIEVLSSTNKATFHNGTSTSPVVTEAHTATLTNKTIDANGTGNSISNLETADLAAGVLNTSTTLAAASNTQLPSALAVKTYVDDKTAAQNEASEISFTPVGNIVATNVQTMGQELDADLTTEATTRATEDTTLQTNIDNHINDATGAHAASAIANTPSGNLAATDQQSVNNELQSDIDTRATSTALSTHISDTANPHSVTKAQVGLSNVDNTSDATKDAAVATLTNKTLTAPVINSPTGIVKADVGLDNVDNTSDANKPISTATQTALDLKAAGAASSTDNHLARFDGTTGKIIQDGSTAVLSDAGALSGLTGITSSGDINSTGKLVIAGITQEGTTSDGVTTGANATISTPSNGIIRLSNASLSSVDMINGPVTGQSLTIINHTGNTVTINNDTGGTAANRILTGTGDNLTLADQASILLKYDATETRWMIIGGSGSATGGAASLDTIFQLTATEQLADWATGDDATFLGGGTLAGTFDYNTSTPLSGDQSYRYTQAAGSLNDYLASPAQDVALRFRGQDVTLFFPYKYDGATNDIEVVFYDVTNAAIIPSSAFLSNAPTVSIFKSNIVIPTTCTSIRVGFQTDVLNSGKILEFADVQLSSDTTVYADIDNDLQSSFLFVSGTVTNAIVSGVATRTSGSGIFSYNSATGVYTMLKRGKVTVSYGGLFAASSCTPTIRRNSAAVANSVQANGGLSTTTAYTEVLDVGVTFDCFASGGISNNYVSVSAQAGNTYILTAPETFSSDTAAFTYAGSGTYTIATLANAPVGTYITFAYATSTNTRTQTTGSGAGNLRPTQTDSSMNTNGILIYPRAYNAASTGELPAAIAIQIGKGLKGKSLDLYKSTGKTTAGSLDFWGASTTAFSTGAAFKDYNESTGILLVDAGYQYNTAVTTANFQFSDLTTQTSGYVVINASKNPALTGLNVNRVAARGVNTAGTSIANNTVTTLVYDAAKTFDTHGALNTATGIFTCPAGQSGYYQVSGATLYANLAWTSGNVVDLYIYKNGALYANGKRDTVMASITTPFGASVSDTVYLNAGDTLNLSTYQTRGSASTLITSAGWNYFSICKQGN